MLNSYFYLFYTTRKKYLIPFPIRNHRCDQLKSCLWFGDRGLIIARLDAPLVREGFWMLDPASKQGDVLDELLGVPSRLAFPWSVAC